MKNKKLYTFIVFGIVVLIIIYINVYHPLQIGGEVNNMIEEKIDSIIEKVSNKLPENIKSKLKQQPKKIQSLKIDESKLKSKSLREALLSIRNEEKEKNIEPAESFEYSKEIIDNEIKSKTNYLLEKLLEKINKVTEEIYILTDYEKIIEMKKENEFVYKIDFFVTNSSEYYLKKLFAEIYYNNETKQIIINNVVESNRVNEEKILLNYPKNSDDGEFSVENMKNKNKELKTVKGIIETNYTKLDYKPGTQKPNISIIRNKWILPDALKSETKNNFDNNYILNEPDFMKKRKPGFLIDCLD